MIVESNLGGDFLPIPTAEIVNLGLADFKNAILHIKHIAPTLVKFIF